jgi:predicted nucleic acid-binding Zn ribbon protein
VITVVEDSLPPPIPLKFTLSRLIRTRGLANRTATDELSMVWTRIVGPELGQRSRPRKINNGIVEVVVTNGAALEQLRSYLHESVLTQLQSSLPQSAIRGIKYIRSG